MLFGNWPKFTLGRIRTIPIRLDATFAIVPVFLLKGNSLAVIAEYWPSLLAATIGIFLSILLHELGHAHSAKYFRVGVREIVVGGFYGYASLKGRAVPRALMIRILAAGPFANLGIFLVIWFALSAPPILELWVSPLALPEEGALVWLRAVARPLALINLALFVFNLLPAFPLDGGRILGHFLDRIISMRTSRMIVSSLSILIGCAMVLSGLGSNIILLIIGFFVIMTNFCRFPRGRAS